MTESTTKDAEQWRKKYSKLIAELDASSERTALNEKQLCRVITRLTLAAKGFDRSLDPHLSDIRNLLKKGLNNEVSRGKLDQLSDRLLRCDESGSNTSSVVDAGSEVQRDQEQKPGLIGKFLGRSTGQKNQSKLDSNTIRGAMLDLLKEYNVPEQFSDSFQKLCSHLGEEADTKVFRSVVEETAQLLVEAKDSMLNEQQELEEFLTHLTNELGELGRHTIDANLAEKATSPKRDSYENLIVDQFEDLREKTQKATELDQLQELIKYQLDLIASQVASNTEVETKWHKDAEAKFEALTDRVQQMELETGDLRSKLRMAHNKAFHDSLTGLPNRLAYDERIAQEVPRWQRFNQPLSMLVWDVDHFKSINDRFGHSAGDMVLKKVSEDLARDIRQTDFVCRYGGEEFVMLLPGATSEAAWKVAENVRTRIHERGFHSQGKRIEMSISCGMSLFESGDTAEQVFDRADKALYKAKTQGRNQCVVG